MLWLIAILATGNLCLGFALGAWFGWSALGIEELPAPRLAIPGLGRLTRRSKGTAAAEDDEDSDTAPPPPATEPAGGLEPPPSEDPDRAPDPPLDASSDGAQADEEEDPRPIAAEVMEGLAAFQAQLANLSEELNDAEEEEAFNDCAERMQQANYEYLDHATDAIEQLEGADESGAVCNAVRAGAEEVQRVSDEFDVALSEGQSEEVPSDETREKVRGLSDKMAETARSAEQCVRRAAPGADDQAASLPPLEIDPQTRLASLDSLLARIETLLAEGSGRPPLLVATVQLDASEESPLPTETLPSLLPRLGEAVADAAGPLGPPALYNGDQLLLALPGDSVDEASRRVELVRQQVAATTFVDGGEERRVTVSCGMAQSAPDSTIEQLQGLLAEALSEAHRYGGDRACHHDGKFPAPLMPEDVPTTPRTVTL